MNMSAAEDTVNWLFLDLNSFFASCEQQARPELRGKPIIIVPMLTDSTCAIAASYQAKAYGIKTGTPVWEAKKICPDLVVVQARHHLYMKFHHRIVEAVESCVPVEKISSIDEMACRLMGDERQVPKARALAAKVKQTIRERAGDCMTCSVGLAPSLFLGKVASDMQKPNGLVVITPKDLPEVLYPLELTDIYGIGARMEQRLYRVGIGCVEDLMQASRQRLRQAWGGIYGVLYYELLHGADLQFPESGKSQSMSHEHVLEPAMRTMLGAQQFSQHLLTKAAERLRHTGHFCRRLALDLSCYDEGRYWQEVGFQETQSTDFLLERLSFVWKQIPLVKPIKVGVVLQGLVTASVHQADLFAYADPAVQRHQKLSPLVDEINKRYGRGAIGFGKIAEGIKTFSGHASFQRVPEEYEF